MADEMDEGIDKQKILAEIGSSGAVPGSPRSPAPRPAQASVPVPVPVPVSAPAVPPPPVLPRRPGRVVRHRRQLAALALVFVSVLWFSVGIATRERIPLAIGGTFLGIAVLVGVGTLLRED